MRSQLTRGIGGTLILLFGASGVHAQSELGGKPQPADSVVPGDAGEPIESGNPADNAPLTPDVGADREDAAARTPATETTADPNANPDEDAPQTPGVGEETPVTGEERAGPPTPGGGVRDSICDDYGTGYSTIAGTETCLRTGGYIRFDSGFADLNGLDTSNPSDGTADTWGENTRFTFNTYTSSETRLGTLSTFAEVRFNYGNSIDPDMPGDLMQNSDSSFSLNFAWIQLGGLRMGKGETLFDTFTGYGGAVINDVTVGGYGPFDTNFVSYTRTSGALSGAIGLEQGEGQYLINEYLPHIVLAAGYEAGPLLLRGSIGYDVRDGEDPAGDDLGGYAAKLRADYSMSEDNDVFLMGLVGRNSGYYTTWAIGDGSEDTFSLMAGHSTRHTEMLASNSQLQWVQANDGADDAFNIVVNLAYDVVPGLTLTPELQYLSGADGEDAFGGVIRAQLSF